MCASLCLILPHPTPLFLGLLLGLLCTMCTQCAACMNVFMQLEVSLHVQEPDVSSRRAPNEHFCTFVRRGMLRIEHLLAVCSSALNPSLILLCALFGRCLISCNDLLCWPSMLCLNLVTVVCPLNMFAWRSPSCPWNLSPIRATCTASTRMFTPLMRPWYPGIFYYLKLL